MPITEMSLVNSTVIMTYHIITTTSVRLTSLLGDLSDEWSRITLLCPLSVYLNITEETEYVIIVTEVIKYILCIQYSQSPPRLHETTPVIRGDVVGVWVQSGLNRYDQQSCCHRHFCIKMWISDQVTNYLLTHLSYHLFQLQYLLYFFLNQKHYHMIYLYLN